MHNFPQRELLALLFSLFNAEFKDSKESYPNWSKALTKVILSVLLFILTDFGIMEVVRGKIEMKKANDMEMRNAKCGMRNAKCEMRNAKCEMRNAKCEMRNAKKNV